ncbi:MAG: SprT family zinc-dependent metalloprotease [Candidimonas sp.]
MSELEQLTLFPAFTPPDPSPVDTTPVVSGTVIPTPAPPELPPNARWRVVGTVRQPIGFILLRSRRKSIGLSVDDDGLRVTAPGWVTLNQIDQAVKEKARWILSKLALRQARQQHLATAETLWQDGGTIPYLGKRIMLSLASAQKSPQFDGAPFAPLEGDKLRLPLPMHADRHRVRDSVHAWLQHQASIWFAQRLDHFLEKGQLTMRRWRLSGATTRWGSCSSEGNIMLNWRLIHFDVDVIDYVIAHEIAHLKEMNHSKDFWREVGRLMPGFESARAILRRHDPGSLPLI